MATICCVIDADRQLPSMVAMPRLEGPWIAVSVRIHLNDPAAVETALAQLARA